MKISTPEIKVIRFSSEDVIVASGAVTRSFYIPSKQYSGYSGSSDFVEFYGTIGSHSGVGYLIENVSGAKDADSGEREGLMSGGSHYFPDVEVTIPMPDMAPVAKQYYDAFSYDGQYYTNGISYYDQYWNQ